MNIFMPLATDIHQSKRSTKNNMNETLKEKQKLKTNKWLALLLTVLLGPIGLLYTDKLLGTILIFLCLAAIPFYLINFVVWFLAWSFSICHTLLTLRDKNRKGRTKEMDLI